jgi:glucosamine--fructose-6-phosphate aminotransferase (isomerizing)
MCGIFGYVGKEEPLSLFIDGLARLEYRGYDSCGFVGARENIADLWLKKKQGKISQLKEELKADLAEKFSLSILHTRWATHGGPSEANAHPHLCRKHEIAIVHNGIIENYLRIKESLSKEGYKFESETDTEVIVHLIEKYYEGDLEDAVYKAIKNLKGSFALGVISRREPDKLIVARMGSPLIIGMGRNGNFLASDIPALLPFTKEVVYLKDNEMAVLKKGNVDIFNFDRERVECKVEQVDMEIEDAQKNGFPHFMLKEIFEQPKVLEKTLSLYIKDENITFPNINFDESFLKGIGKLYITACGTAYHAGYVGKYLLEKYCDLDVVIDTSSEFRYRKLNLGEGDLLIAISQSGETADTLAAVKEASKKGAKVLSICNVLGSSLVKESHGLIYTLAGPEIGVASTKAYTSQLFVMYLFSLYLAKIKGVVSEKQIADLLEDLRKVPVYIESILNDIEKIKKIAGEFSRFGCFLFLGRGINFPCALEGALKLKEISYIPAEGYPAGEMKHGPIALIDEYRGVVCIAPGDQLYEKMVSNMQEIKARKGKVLGILNQGDQEASLLTDAAIYIPKFENQDCSPFLTAVCLQLFAYFVANNLECEIDQPRNLAKSVTVE